MSALSGDVERLSAERAASSSAVSAATAAAAAEPSLEERLWPAVIPAALAPRRNAPESPDGSRNAAPRARLDVPTQSPGAGREVGLTPPVAEADPDLPADVIASVPAAVVIYRAPLWERIAAGVAIGLFMLVTVLTLLLTAWPSLPARIGELLDTSGVTVAVPGRAQIIPLSQLGAAADCSAVAACFVPAADWRAGEDVAAADADLWRPAPPVFQLQTGCDPPPKTVVTDQFRCAVALELP